MRAVAPRTWSKLWEARKSEMVSNMNQGDSQADEQRTERDIGPRSAEPHDESENGPVHGNLGFQ